MGLVLYTIYRELQEKETFSTSINAEEKIDREAFNITLPEEFYFCGEAVPLNEPDVRERLDKELHRNVFFHSNTFLLLKRANRWLPEISKVMEGYGLPDDLKYLVIIESALTNVTSPAGAVGFWQIMETTGKEFGLTINQEVDERYDPIKSTHVACRYFKQAYKRFGSWTLAAASYNRGMAGIERALEKQRVDSFYDLQLNSETAHYVFRAMAIKEIFENPGKYQYDLQAGQLYYPEKARTVEVTESIPDLVSFALQQGINYKLLKLHNPWLRSERLSVPEGKTFTLKIPEVVAGTPVSLDDPTTETITDDTLPLDSPTDSMTDGELIE